MSDTQEGPGWWQSSQDGKWYAPGEGPPPPSGSAVPTLARRKRSVPWKWLLPSGVGLVLAVAAITAVVLHNRTVNTRETILGTFTLHDLGGIRHLGAAGGAGSGGYSDIGTGAAVTITDASGKVIGVDSLDVGSGSGSGSNCTFPFSVLVPRTGVYQIEISHRGKLPYQRATLEARAWHVDLTLG